jgi:hypothetical protein
MSHTPTTRPFGPYSVLITLHHAHLAHALERTERAVKCHRVAALLASASLSQTGEIVGGDCVRISARAGEVGLRIGLARAGGAGGGAGLDGETKKMGRLYLSVGGWVGTLEAIGRSSNLSDEIIKSKYALHFQSPTTNEQYN